MVQDAEQDVALVEDQVSVEVLSKRTEVGSADKLTVGAGVVGEVGELPPPPPPPHPRRNAKITKTENSLIVEFILISHLTEYIFKQF